MPDRVILLVDDEPHILNSLKRLLRQENYSILAATSGREGLELLKAHPVQMVVSDQRMPEMTGIEFLKQVKNGYPDTVRVVLSGYADVMMIVDAINQGEIYRFLTKPWNDDELRVALRQCFNHYDLLQQNKSLLLQITQQNDELKQLNDGLEQAVVDRTRLLQLSQEILRKLPLAVLGISEDGMVVLANDAVSAMLGGITLGADIKDILPEDAQKTLQRGLTCGEGESSTNFMFNGTSLRMLIKPVGGGAQQIRGCIVVIEREANGR